MKKTGARVLVAGLLVAGCSTVTPEPSLVAAQGLAFEQTRWDMTLAQVHRLYPAARAQAAELLLDAPIGGQPALVRFRFDRGALAVVEVDLSGGAESEACGPRFEAAWRELAARHGSPLRGDAQSGVWAPAGSEVVLSCRAMGDPPRQALLITYRASGRRPSIPRFDPIPAPRPGHEYE